MQLSFREVGSWELGTKKLEVCVSTLDEMIFL